MIAEDERRVLSEIIDSLLKHRQYCKFIYCRWAMVVYSVLTLDTFMLGKNEEFVPLRWSYFITSVAWAVLAGHAARRTYQHWQTWKLIRNTFASGIEYEIEK